MDLTAIPDLRVDSAGDEVTYRLPRRPLGKFRLAGLVPIGFSAVWIGGLAKMFWPIWQGRAAHAQPMNDVLPAVVLVVAAAGLAPAIFGLGLMFGRARIQWRQGRLSALDAMGPFFWRRRLPKTAPRRLVVLGVNNNATALLAEFASGPPRLVAAGYPRDWLEAMARDLSARIGIAPATGPAAALTGDGSAPDSIVPKWEKPPRSPVVVKHNDASTVLEVPPLGLIKGSMGLFLFACAWCAFLIVFTFVVRTQGHDPGLRIFLALFWLVGLGLMTGAVQLGRRRAILTAGPSGLTMIKSGPLGVKRLEYRRSEITGVGVGPSGMKVNERPVPELKIQLATGREPGLLAGHREDELRWMASELQRALGITDPNPPALEEPANPLAAWQTRRSPAGVIVAIAVFAVLACAIFGKVIFMNFARIPEAQPLPPQVQAPRRFAAPPPGLAFTSFGSGGSYATNVWFIGHQAHADWFVPAASGPLKEIDLAIEPQRGLPRPGKLTVFIAPDNHGSPGPPLESFSAHANDATDPVSFESVNHPLLQAGAKYWVSAQSTGAWLWHFNDQRVAQNAARSLPHQQWASAGDYCYVCAFCVGVSTNPVTSTADDSGLETNR